MPLPLEVVKVGGSLLRCANFYSSLDDWIQQQQQPRSQLLIIGGGQLVNHLRKVHSALPLRESSAHWLAIEAMQLQACRVHCRLPELPPVTSLDAVRNHHPSHPSQLMLCRDFLATEEPLYSGTTLQVGWQVTSDSIAARVAICLGARLRLLKSRSATKAESNNWHHAAETGLVDQFFPRLAPELNSIVVEKFNCNSC